MLINAKYLFHIGINANAQRSQKKNANAQSRLGTNKFQLQECSTNNSLESTFVVDGFLFFFSVFTPHVQACCFTSEVVLSSWWGSLVSLAFFLVTISVFEISDCLLTFLAALLELTFCSYADTASGISGFSSESSSLFSSLICAEDSGKSLGATSVIYS